jgi:hypothetical protein
LLGATIDLYSKQILYGLGILESLPISGGSGSVADVTIGILKK